VQPLFFPKAIHLPNEPRPIVGPKGIHLDTLSIWSAFEYLSLIEIAIKEVNFSFPLWQPIYPIASVNDTVCV
jgi:hypothetical protein